MKKSINQFIFIFFLVFYCVALTPTNAIAIWNGGDCPRYNARVANYNQGIKLTAAMETIIPAIDKVLEAFLGSDWETIITTPPSTTASTTNDFLGVTTDLEEGFGRMNFKNFINPAHETAFNVALSDPALKSLTPIIKNLMDNRDWFVDPDPTKGLVGSEIQGVIEKRQRLYNENLIILHAESLRVQKAFEDGELDKKINRVIDDYLNLADGSSLTPIETFRSNSVAVVVQGIIILTLVEFELQELRTAVLRDIINMPIRLLYTLGDEVETLKDPASVKAGGYIDDLISTDKSGTFWK